jgi:hypothetical protein
MVSPQYCKAASSSYELASCYKSLNDKSVSPSLCMLLAASLKLGHCWHCYEAAVTHTHWEQEVPTAFLCSPALSLWRCCMMTFEALAIQDDALIITANAMLRNGSFKCIFNLSAFGVLNMCSCCIVNFYKPMKETLQWHLTAN